MERRKNIRHRPPRLARLFSNLRPFYFVTFNTHARRKILACPEIHETFRAFCRKAVNHHVAVGRYVILPDHIHMFVVMPAEGILLARWVQSLRANVGKTLLALGHAKPHWQEGFFDHLLRSGESYTEKWAYVLQNPVRAGLAGRTEDWPYQGEIETITF